MDQPIVFSTCFMKPPAAHRTDSSVLFGSSLSHRANDYVLVLSSNRQEETVFTINSCLTTADINLCSSSFSFLLQSLNAYFPHLRNLNDFPRIPKADCPTLSIIDDKVEQLKDVWNKNPKTHFKQLNAYFVAWIHHKQKTMRNIVLFMTHSYH